jgi:hypothetical protein
VTSAVECCFVIAGVCSQNPAEKPDAMTIDTKNILQRTKHGTIRFGIMFLYLLSVFALFQLHEYIVLSQHNIEYTRYGFAIINALLLAKVMLVADEMKLGKSFSDRPLIYAVLLRSVLFALVFIAFDFIEKTIEGLIKGHSLLDSIPTLAGGFLGSVMFVCIMAVMLIPFFAFVEVNKLLGPGGLQRLLLKGERPSP